MGSAGLGMQAKKFRCLDWNAFQIWKFNFFALNRKKFIKGFLKKMFTFGLKVKIFKFYDIFQTLDCDVIL